MASRYTELKNMHEARLGGERPDLTRHSGKDFHNALDELASAKGKSDAEKQKIFNTVLGTGDFADTYDLDISVPGGYWDKIIARGESLANVRAIPTQSHKIESIELTLGTAGEDVWRPGVQGTDLTEPTTIDTATREFIPEEVLAIFGVTDNLLEDNLEHDSLQAHIERMIVDTAANEWAKACYNGVKVGTTNSSRGAITGCFDGFVYQINAGGNIVYSTSYEDRYVSSIQENDKFLAGAKALPSKYSDAGMTWMTTRNIMLDWNAELGQRPTALGDSRMLGWMTGLTALGYPMYNVPALRTTYPVKATGVVMGTTPVDTTLASIAMAHQKDIVLSAADNAANDLVYAIGCDAAGTSFALNSELVVENGGISTVTVTCDDNLQYDHAATEIVTEYSTSPTITGIPALLTSWGNLAVYYQRVMRIEPYRLPRLRKTDFVVSARLVPVVFNPDAAVIVRDLAAR